MHTVEVRVEDVMQLSGGKGEGGVAESVQPAKVVPLTFALM